ncbi:MAG: L,D-transpeptidase [Gammaproteobacteria bacterium]
MPIRTLLGLALTLWIGGWPAPANADAWILIDTRADRLAVIGDEGPLAVFDHIAIGRGAGIKQRRGDAITPIGSFRVVSVNRASRFHLFLGLDYPNLEHAALANRAGKLGDSAFAAIRNALKQGRTPPQTTALGGAIGVHGIGGGNPRVHAADIDWTNGCIALTDRQIDRVATLVKVGARVEIR